MKNNLVFIGIMLLLMGLISCKEEELSANATPKADHYLIFGTYYGECMENCVNIYYLQPDEALLLKAEEASYPRYDAGQFPYEDGFDTLSSQAYTLAEPLLEALPASLFEEDERVIGEPDSMDQGGIYIETKEGGETRQFYIDTHPDNIPAYLHDFVSRVSTVVSQLRDEEE